MVEWTSGLSTHFLQLPEHVTGPSTDLYLDQKFNSMTLESGIILKPSRGSFTVSTALAECIGECVDFLMVRFCAESEHAM